MTATRRTHFARIWRAALAALAAAGLTGAQSVGATTTTGSLTFTTTALTTAQGNSEPEISAGADGSLAMVALGWNSPFGTNLWTGPFGSTPTSQGSIDNSLQHPSKQESGGGDADVDLGSTGTLHATSLVFLGNPTGRKFQLGVSAIRCPDNDSSGCTGQIIDLAGADRPWITSDGMHVWISYHDAGRSTTVHVQRSDDDGLTWKRAGDPITGQGQATGDATFNNTQGPLRADPSNHTVYDVYAAGHPGFLKAKTATFDQVFVSSSTDLGQHWTSHLVFQTTTTPGTGLDNIFPAMGVDPATGDVYASWSDTHTIWLSKSTDHASTWSTPEAISIAPVSSALMPWVAAHNGQVDVVYYGTSAGSNLDSTANWFVYLANSTDGGANFTQNKVNSATNHIGVICTNGTGCTTGTRNLLDLFQVAIDPLNGKAAIIYTDDTLTTTPAPNFSCLPNQDPCPLPQVVLAQQT